MNVKIEVCRDGALIPEYKNDGDAGCDLSVIEDISINPKETKIIPTGLKVVIPYGFEIQIRPRSGVSLKTKLRISNSPGTIDCNYRDEIGIIVDNIGDEVIQFKKGGRIAQMVLQEVPMIVFEEVDDVTKYSGNRGGGFGSTGK